MAVVTGSIDDRAALARTLGLPSETAQHVLAAAAYGRWGAEMPSRLRGAFAVLVWDRARSDGLVAVDQLGARSLVYRQAGASLTFATELRELLPLLETAPPPRERAAVRWLVDGVLETDETLFTGVRRLPGGHLLRLGTEGARPERYWEPSPPGPQRIDRDAATRRLGSALGRAVARGASRGEPTGILLSGGLDSSSVAAFARAAGARLVAYSVVFPEQPAADEAALVTERATALGLPTRRLAFRSGSALAAGLRHLDAWRVPPPSPNLFFHEPLLRLARSDGIVTMLDGQGGDELFGASPYLLADRLRAGRVAAASALARAYLGPRNAAVPAARREVMRRFALKGALPSGVHRAMRSRLPARYTPAWLTPAGAAAYGGGPSTWAWKEFSGPRWWAYLSDVVSRGRERAGVHDSLRHLFASAGLCGAHPLLEDVDLVEETLALPPELAFDARLDRPLLRAAVAGLLPDAVRLREDKSYFNDVLAAALHGADDPPLRRLLGQRAETRRYVRAELVDRLRATPTGRRGGPASFLLWRLAMVECWLQTLADPGFPAKALDAWGLAEPRFEVLDED